ncbi:hypothetical protein [Sphaerimonospora thailandensis]|uniref:Uncharacterized protein n=1 Tax=Sphaerimonospora thailandensis TaxID=795644 RepID=A0A8J3R3W6_9ACTN|nr:hypothetical protein [Sphaerimonospora thailandensis]GIH67898.1 hypothetical protein Mth01_01510 [Sphaerimonospora thailandensis]
MSLARNSVRNSARNGVRDNLPAIVTLLIVAGFGLFGVSLVTRVGYLAVPAALGLPYGPPGLRLVPLGETTWLMTLTESAAALVLVAVVALARGGFQRAWGAFVTGTVLAFLLRAVVLAQTVSAGLGAYAAYLAGAVVMGLVWGIVFGWLPGLAALPRGKARSEGAAEVIDNAAESA